ncbi:hypothetical protein D3C78_717130 [compost metagenome]
MELGDTDVAVVVLQQLALHALDLDDRAGQGHVEGIAAVAHQGQGDFLADLAAHLVDRFGHGLATGRGAVDLDDQVAGLHAGTRGRGVIDRRDNLDEAVFLAYFDAQPAELAAGAFLQLLEVLGAEVGRVRVKVAEHALDGIFQQGLVIHRLHIGRLDAVHDLGEGAQLFKRQWRLGGHLGGRYCGRLGRVRGSGQGRADRQGDGQGQLGETRRVQHVERTPDPVSAPWGASAQPVGYPVEI